MSFNVGERWLNALEEIKQWARIKSPWLIHFNSGSCNGCDIEILATLTPRYDAERFGDLIPNRAETKERPFAETADLGILVIQQVLPAPQDDDQKQRHAYYQKT